MFGCTEYNSSTHTKKYMIFKKPMVLTKSTFWFRYDMNILSFFQSSTLLFANLVVNNVTSSYIYGIFLFVIYINFEFNKWNKSDFISLNNYASSFTHHKCCAHDKVTLKPQTSLNCLTMSSIWCFIIRSTLLSFLIFIFMNNKSYMSPLLITRSPKCF